ncbi:MAG: YhcN/YlaJ family sporulation lipoprotein [Defluviitaleaceae bacterium]|nr:YhcN/YlaJ family sporulation lipoprotein [Defluviitaleaceae bacterium]MCL2835388.1 YhcN/YlaJ family sporulation lipoprotein [Defluviitaleaceae bacterium]
MKKYMLFAVMFLLTGCVAANNAGMLLDEGIPLDGMERAYKPDRSYYVDGREMEFEECDGMGIFNNDVSRREEDINAYIKELDGVESANALINGRAAIIGIRFCGNPDTEDIKRIKQSVKEHALGFDSDLIRVAVTAAPELYERTSGAAVTEQKSHVTPRYKRLFPVIPTF